MDEFNKNNVMSNNEVTFRFYPFDSCDKHKWCDVTANVKLIKYDNGTEYYYISYEYVFSDKNLTIGEIDECHPFYGNNDLIEHMEGDVLVKNSLSDKLVEYVLMGFDELSEFTGHSTPQGYKGNIMKAITYFWD